MQRKLSKFEKSVTEVKDDTIVVYRNKKWNIQDLLFHMDKRIKDLEKMQCKPKLACSYKYREYLMTLSQDEIDKILEEIEEGTF